MTKKPFFLLAACALVVSPAAADELRVGLGAGFAPDYEGSDDYGPIPFPSFKYETDVVTIESSRLGVQADFVNEQGFDLGPILRWDMGRSDVEDAVVDRLDDVDGSLEFGGFAGLSYPVLTFEGEAPLMFTSRLEVVHGVTDGHNGLTGTVSAGLLKPFSDFTLGGSASLGFSSDDYASAYFSVSAAESARTGLAQYDAEGGARNVGLNLFSSYALTERWSLTGVANYSRLIGDAADSPIVDQRGDANQFFVGFGVSFQIF